MYYCRQCRKPLFGLAYLIDGHYYCKPCADKLTDNNPIGNLIRLPVKKRDEQDLER